MRTLLIYIFESTASLGIFYLVFRLLMRGETNFAVNRSVLLGLVVASVIVPLVQLPVKLELIPEFYQNKIQLQNISEAGQPTLIEDYVSANELIPESNQLNLSLDDVLLYVYLGGVMLSFLLFARGILMVLLILRKAKVLQMDGSRLFIIDREIPSFAFGRSVVISQHDYDLHGEAILTHEQAHIRQKHFYDLFLLELVKIFHWFNPAIYALTGDMKEIHEYQADAQTVGSGVDAKQYQLLIIQKGVGPNRFALANSFNHCQIKKRIIMMNKQKTSKAWRWKVATFLPLLALLLMAFGKTGENVNSEKKLSPQIVTTLAQDSVKKMSKAVVAPPPTTKQSKIKYLPPPPNKDIHIISVESDNQMKYNGGEILMNNLEEKIKSEIHGNPKLIYYVHVEEGKVDFRVAEIQRILKDNGNPLVKFFSSHYQDKGIHSRDQYWQKIQKKPMEIKMITSPKESSQTQTQIKKQFAIIVKVNPEVLGKGKATIELTKNGKEKSMIEIPINEKYPFNLDYFNEYTLKFKYPEHLDKTILVSTEIPNEVWQKDSNFSTFPMVVNLMKKTDQKVKSDEGKPILKIAYIKELDNFGKVAK